MISKKRSDLYFTVSEDERRALVNVQRIELKIALRNQKNRNADHPLENSTARIQYQVPEREYSHPFEGIDDGIRISENFLLRPVQLQR